ncbi:MAG: nuclear transport factor 2 family protein [Rhodocyclaceae bacterium]|jgi:hypothetical protein|nr:nuclear transport factor 2 family protein [Rhodocyclaceae bacterium]
MTTPEESLRVTAELARASADRDAGIFERLYADDATIWHAVTRKTQTKAENACLLRSVPGPMSNARYDEVTQLPPSEGFAQHHVVRGTFIDGQPVPELYAGLVVTVSSAQDHLLARMVRGHPVRRSPEVAGSFPLAPNSGPPEHTCGNRLQSSICC